MARLSGRPEAKGGFNVADAFIEEIHRVRQLPGQSRLEAISEADTPERIRKATVAAAEYVGFSSVQLMLIVPTPKITPFVMVESSDEMLQFDRALVIGSELASPYDFDLADPCLDPVVRRMKHSPIPIAWSGDTYTDVGLGEVRDWWVENDRGCGVTMSVPMNCGDANQSLDLVVAAQRREEITVECSARLCADVALIAMHAVMGSKKSLVPLLLSARHAASPLTPTMRQYLLWAERGKTASETADIVGRKYNTVKNVLCQALERLDCSNKTDAIRIARMNGWL